MTMEPKQVIVMRWDLGMRRGEEIAQGAHVAMIWMSLRIREPNFTFTEAERHSLDGAFIKVCVPVDSEEDLLKVIGASEEMGVMTLLGPDEVPWCRNSDLLYQRAGLSRPDRLDHRPPEVAPSEGIMITRAYVQEEGNGRLGAEERDLIEGLRALGIAAELFTRKQIARRRLSLDRGTLVAGDLCSGLWRNWALNRRDRTIVRGVSGTCCTGGSGKAP